MRPLGGVLLSIGLGVLVRGVDHGEDTRGGSDWNVKIEAIFLCDIDGNSLSN